MVFEATSFVAASLIHSGVLIEEASLRFHGAEPSSAATVSMMPTREEA
jgi:hypothetical protein